MLYGKKTNSSVNSKQGIYILGISHIQPLTCMLCACFFTLGLLSIDTYKYSTTTFYHQTFKILLSHDWDQSLLHTNLLTEKVIRKDTDIVIRQLLRSLKLSRKISGGKTHQCNTLSSYFFNKSYSSSSQNLKLKFPLLPPKNLLSRLFSRTRF